MDMDGGGGYSQPAAADLDQPTAADPADRATGQQANDPAHAASPGAVPAGPPPAESATIISTHECVAATKGATDEYITLLVRSRTLSLDRMPWLRALRDIARQPEVVRAAAEMTERRDAHMAACIVAGTDTKPSTSELYQPDPDDSEMGEYCKYDGGEDSYDGGGGYADDGDDCMGYESGDALPRPTDSGGALGAAPAAPGPDPGVQPPPDGHTSPDGSAAGRRHRTVLLCDLVNG